MFNHLVTSFGISLQVIYFIHWLARAVSKQRVDSEFEIKNGTSDGCFHVTMLGGVFAFYSSKASKKALTKYAWLWRSLFKYPVMHCLNHSSSLLGYFQLLACVFPFPKKFQKCLQSTQEMTSNPFWAQLSRSGRF